MKIKSVAVGNREEAFIEKNFSDGLNIMLSDDNNKGKTIVIQSILYALGNKPIFPASFNYKNYLYYLEFEHDSREYVIIRTGDSYILKTSDGIRLFDGMSELKRFWTNNIFSLPEIQFKGSRIIVDMELYTQLFFVGQDSKDTSTIFNQGYYHKDDFRNMLLSYAGDFASEIMTDEMRKLEETIRTLKAKRQEKIKLSEFYKTVSPATEYLSKIKDRDAFNKRVEELDAITENISDIRKKRNHLASKKVLWNGTLKELRSLNRNIEVGELRCMDCDSVNIAYKGTGKVTYSFDVSTPEMRTQIISSIQENIADIEEDIKRYDFDIQKLQDDLNRLMSDDDITIENIVAYKSGYVSAEEIEKTVLELDAQIQQYEGKVKAGVSLSDEAKKTRDIFFEDFMKLINEQRVKIDPESDKEYEDIFTKRGTVISGSEETVFYVSKLLAVAEMTDHDCPIIMDSFRAEDLSTEKENRVLKLLLNQKRQCILTTTLKAEEKGKYNSFDGIHVIDYTKHKTNKVLEQHDLNEFKALLAALNIEI